jgi:acrylyl-CoA reductase (NADPH)/3-hydroxypropionyl-CoA dehydratase/3-hydroxypropionyl-CoA synthetase
MPIDSTTDNATKRELIESDELLAAGSPFIPGETPLPDYQLAWGITSDEDGKPIHGEPEVDSAETEMVIPVEDPGPNEALLYMLTSEVNYNDVWAVTGIPVSTFRGHDRDWHITGSGGLALVVEVGSGVEDEERIEVGDLVHVYAGQFDALSPEAGRDPMYADFQIQGYETPDGSHQQFMVAQATQLFEPPSNLNLTEAGSYILTMGTIYRALFNTLDVEPGSDIFIEGASTGSGRDAVGMAASRGLDITGLVSSPERGERAKRAGADAAIDRKQDALADAMRIVPNDPDEWDDWVSAGKPLLDEFHEKNDGTLADYAISHAGQEAFSRSYQLLGEGGRLTFYGASTGYEMAFMGKKGISTPGEIYDRSELRPGQAVLVWYGTPERIGGTTDEVGAAAIEAALDRRARVAVVTETAEQADLIKSTYDIDGAVSLETLAAENGDFAFVDSLPSLPKPSQPDELAATIGEYSSKMFKPIGRATGEFLATPNNPRGNPDVVFERAGQNTLGVSTMLCAPFMGNVVYSEDMSEQRYSFYAPQVWMRQRRIFMPTTEIFGTHMKNTYEVLKMNEEIERDIFDVPQTHLVNWEDTPQAHQDMWGNNHEEGSYVINHALPDAEIDSKEALFEQWDA